MLNNRLSISIVMACALMTGNMAFATTTKPVSTLADQEIGTHLTDAQIDRVYQLKQSLGISSASDHKKHFTHNTTVDKSLITDLHKVLKKYDDIGDKLAIITGINNKLEKGHIHVNHNFALKMSERDQKYVDVIYTAYLFTLYERTKGMSGTALKAEFNKIEREVPFEFYEADLEKIRKKFG